MQTVVHSRGMAVQSHHRGVMRNLYHVFKTLTFLRGFCQNPLLNPRVSQNPRTRGFFSTKGRTQPEGFDKTLGKHAWQLPLEMLAGFYVS